MLTGDDPVGADSDKLRRAALAFSWADLLDRARSPRGLVFAVTGPWGSGKTSMLIMLQERLANIGRQVITFNPWLFSGTDQLVEIFFDELATQLDLVAGDEKKSKVAAALRRYGTLFGSLKAIPILGMGPGAGAEAIANYGKLLEEAQHKDVHGKRTFVEEALKELDEPIIVVLDDIDRLTGQEIRDVLRMVRLTGAFENVIYVLAFDRARVERALDEDGLPGQAYLEKIVQVMLTVPVAPPHMIRDLLGQELDQLMAELQVRRFTAEYLPDVFFEVVDPLIRTIRDVRRYVAPLPAALLAVADRVEAVDVLALEAVRIFLPRAFERLAGLVDVLTETDELFGGSDRRAEEGRRAMDAFLAAEPAHGEVLRSVCRRLFPASLRHLGENSHYGSEWTKTWTRQRRVASGHVLRFYLQNVSTRELDSVEVAEQAFSTIESGVEFRSILSALPPSDCEGAIAALEAYESEFKELDLAAAIAAILDQENRMDRESTGFFDFGPRLVIGRVVYRMLRAIGEASASLRVTDQVAEQLGNLTAESHLLSIVGYSENAGHKLIPEPAWIERIEQLREKVRAASPEDLAQEASLLRLLWDAGPPDVEGRWVVTDQHLAHAKFCTALLGRAISRGQSVTMGTRHTTTHERLSWDILTAVVGGASGVAQLRECVVQALGVDNRDVVLLDRYLSGWRPDDFE